MIAEYEKILLVLGVGVLLLSSFLFSLEIRLPPPNRFYNLDNVIYIDISSTDSLLSGDDVQNLFYDIPITVTYYIEFYEKKFFFDKQLIDLSLVRRVFYDHWSQQFFIEETGKTFRYRNLTQLRNNMINLKKIRLIEADKINFEKKYYFKTRIAIKIKNFNLYYYLINNLISIFKYKTTYYYSPEYSGKQIFQLSKQTGESN